MPLHLQLTTQQGLCRVVAASAPEVPLAETALDTLPTIEQLLKDPYILGRGLFAALGGELLIAQLQQSDDGVLLLECDEQAEAIAWEYAVHGHNFLACAYAMLRLVPHTPLAVRPGAPRLLVLCADPLVYPEGEPTYRLNFDAELNALRKVFQAGRKALHGQQIPPTTQRLFGALTEGPALLHIGCHGHTVPFQGSSGVSINAALQLEDDVGKPKLLLGSDLRIRAPRGSLQMVLLSACQSAPVARALALQGVPLALGMQHNFPDPCSDELAAELYRALINGYDLAEATRLARNALADADPRVAGMLVTYTCQDAWQTFQLRDGKPTLQLGLAGDCRLPASLLAGDGALVGRDSQLAELACLFTANTTAVTIAGTGGIGKTSLARAFVQRFGWRFGRVLGVSFAAATVDLARVCRELLEQLGLASSFLAKQDESAQQHAELVQIHKRRLAVLQKQQAALGLHSAPHIITEIADIERDLAALDAQDPRHEQSERLVERLLQAIQPNDLVLFDNYESVLTPQDAAEQTQAEAIQRLLPKLLDKQACLLLTSRAMPARLRGEQLFPSNAGMAGLDNEAAVELFLQHSTRAKGHPADQHRQVAQKLAQETHGHPLAIILLAGAYDAHDTDSKQFLDDWGASLARATRPGLDPHHITIDVALERSLLALKPPKRARLIELSHYDVPFFAQAAALIWGLPCDEEGQPTEEALAEARADLALFVQRSLLQIHDTFDGSDQPATYQFQPVLRQALLLRRDSKANKPTGYYSYGAWLAELAYGEIKRSGALAQLVNQSMPLLEATINELQGEQRLWHIRSVAWLYRQYSELQRARSLLEPALKQADDDSAVRGALQYELAEIHSSQGQYERAMPLFQQSLAIHEQLQDLHGVAASLHAMAQIHLRQGQYERAMPLFQQSLDIKEQLQDLQGKAASLHAMAQIHSSQGQYERAMPLFQQSLAILEQLQDLHGKAASLSEIANLHMLTQHWSEASKLLQKALTICQQLDDRAGIAFNQVKLGQSCLSQADYPAAQAHFQVGLAIFEQLGMPREISHTQQLIEQLAVRQTQQQAIEEAIDTWITNDSEPQQESFAEIGVWLA